MSCKNEIVRVSVRECVWVRVQVWGVRVRERSELTIWKNGAVKHSGVSNVMSNIAAQQHHQQQQQVLKNFISDKF